MTFSNGGCTSALAGKSVGIYCTELPDPDDLGLVGTGCGGSSTAVPRRRRTIDTGDLTRGIDYCRGLAPGAQGGAPWAGRLIARSRSPSAAPSTSTSPGDDAGDARAPAGDAGGTAKNTYPTSAQFLDVDRAPSSGRGTIVAASGAVRTRRPPGTIGYYSDGAPARCRRDAVSAAGRRLFIEVSADHTLYTNVAEYFDGVVD